MKYILKLLLIATLIAGCVQQSDRSNVQKTINSESDIKGNSQFVWNFETPKTIVYSYSQELKNTFEIGKEKDDQQISSSIEGTLKVIVKESKMADLNLQVRTSMVTPYKKDTVKNESPPIFVQDMDADGSMDDGNVEATFKFIFPLPTNHLNIGEASSLPMKIPIRAGGTVLYSKGSVNLTYLYDTVLLDRKCVVLEGVVDVTEIKIPEGMDAKVAGGATGNGRYYFDVQSGLFVKVVTKIIMEYDMELSQTGSPFGGDSYMKSINLFEVTLQEIED